MSRRWRWVLAVGGLVAAALVAWGVWFMKHPLDALAGQKRRALAKAGFAPETIGAGAEAVNVFAAGSGPPLVFLHGTGDHAGTWADVAGAFTASHRVLLVDLPGHGDSPPAEGDLAMATVVAGVERVLLAATAGGPTPSSSGNPAAGPADATAASATLVGNSLGAWLATLLAERHPTLVARIVLINGGALLGEPGGASLQPKDRVEAERLINLLRDPAAPPVPGFVLDDIVRRAATGPIARLGRDGAGLIAHLRNADQLAAIATPADLVWGAADRLVPVAYAERLLAALPAARLTPVERCGHVPQVECPQALRETLLRVLAEAPPASRPAAPVTSEGAAASAAGSAPTAPTTPDAPADASDAAAPKESGA